MHVLLISKACVVGAYQKKLEELARFPGMVLTVVVPPGWRDKSGALPLERLHTEGYDLVVLPCVMNGSYHLHFYPGLGGVVRRVRPDLVHVDEEPYNVATAHAIWCARRAGARTIFFSWQNILRRYPLPFRLVERYVLRTADAGIVGNQDSSLVWRAKGYEGPLDVVPQFGVDPELYSPPRERTPPGPGRQLEVGYVGRLVEEKGIDLLLEALSGLAGPWRATIVGSGPALPALQHQVARLGLSARVTFRGQLPSSKMPDAYRRLDVLVLPSRTRPNWKEQFGRALVEAMACGAVAVGSDSGEIPHVIGDAGLIFTEGRGAALRSLLERLAADDALRAELSRRGRERVLACFTQAEIASKTYEVYCATLAGRKDPDPAEATLSSV